MARENREWYKFTVAKAASAEDKPTATLHIYDEIDSWFGVNAEALVVEISALDPETELTVRVNSPGGNAFDGINIANAIMRHPGKTTTYIDGLAASAASVIAVASDEVVVSKYGQAMVHDARSGQYGTAKDLRSVADHLEKLSASYAKLYADRAGGTVEDWAQAMADETWYTAEEMVAAGLASRVDDSGARADTEKAVASALACSSYKFKYFGRPAAPAPVARADNAGACASANISKEGPVPDIKEDVAKRLGLGPDATDEEVLAALDKLASTEQEDTDEDATTTEDDSAEVGAGTAVDGKELVAAAAKAGLVLMDPARVAKLESDAAAGALARQTQVAEAHAKVVDSAVAKGKITAPRRDHFLALMKADPEGTTALLDSIPAETAVPLTEVGHGTEAQASASAEDEIRNDPRFKNWRF
ncbi:ATP-dependent Clp protease proteolytic subunit [Mycobacteroides abscessus subsp. abscessus]|uniref:Capsid maturation protease n=1 Tax=Mycobacterium phage phiT46-1 TaxID=2775045 RepID=A0A7T1TTG5_9CAUD|nr:head maturation protease, ClpP-related [Mycobacteroides abscessus]YP_010050627.1 head maturation protease [Mycobacterium phage phiT46-1]QSM03172.1 capsid maturation protease [Mycobacterium phage prophiGD24-2]QSM03506.1 capsid maturation protease [Mycobacterium phage prophiGD21-3]WJJ56754.1 capsid maturation protease [Mycobacterium phage prophiT46-1]MBN7400001.1 ATP-dependent Clp protease proteolytic subunit [Mycobacteroides abscessus subsp. abscessus]MDB2219618.1 ATP-dependent Clp protease